MTRGRSEASSYGAVVLPMKAAFWQGNYAPEELERSQCPSPSSSLDIETNPLVWEVADRLVLSLLMDSQDDDDEDDLEDEEFAPSSYRDCFDLPKPIPVHPASVALLVTPAATNQTSNNKSNLSRSHSAVW
jgi:hypothetical protein